jgi:ankyrin repeat protein
MDSLGNLPLHCVCNRDEPLEVVRYLVQEYLESLQGLTNGGLLDVIQYLVQFCPESIDVTNNGGYLPLHYACACRALLDVVRYLVQARVPRVYAGHHHRNPLTWSIAHRNKEANHFTKLSLG